VATEAAEDTDFFDGNPSTWFGFAHHRLLGAGPFDKLRVGKALRGKMGKI